MINVLGHSGQSPKLELALAAKRQYGMSQKIRKRIEEGFGWIKTVAGQRKTRFKGKDRVGLAFTFAAAAYNLVRLPKLVEAAV